MNVQLMSTSREWSIPPPHLQRSQQLCHGEICLALRLQVGFAGAKDFECFCSFGKHPQRDLTVEKLLANDNTIYHIFVWVYINICLYNIHTHTSYVPVDWTAFVKSSCWDPTCLSYTVWAGWTIRTKGFPRPCTVTKVSGVFVHNPTHDITWTTRVWITTCRERAQLQCPMFIMLMCLSAAFSLAYGLVCCGHRYHLLGATLLLKGSAAWLRSPREIQFPSVGNFKHSSKHRPSMQIISTHTWNGEIRESLAHEVITRDEVWDAPS